MLSLYVKWLSLKDRLMQDEKGQGLVEYALIVALISLVVLVGSGNIADNITLLFSKIGSHMDTITIPAT